jgi:uncharacterized protein (TIGR03083 family)
MPMASDIPKDRTIAALVEVWASTSELLTSLQADEWSQPSPLPGWTVQDNVSHMVGTEAMLLGEANPDVTIDRQHLAHVTNDIGEFNEVWVEHLRSIGPTTVLAMFDDFTTRRVEVLKAMSLDEWHAESFTPAGKDTYGRFMQIRVFDCWLHEQDIRDATGRLGNETGLAGDVTLDEMTTALGFVVGKKAGLADGESVTFSLTDAGSLIRSIHVAIEGRAKVVDTLDGEATATLTLPVGSMTRLCAGRASLESLRAGIDVAGDAELGERVLSNLNYTI